MPPRETAAGFLLHAKEFLTAAELVLNSVENISLPAYFLLGRSIELSLKAFLLGRGQSAIDLKSPRTFGHNLASLLEEAMRRNLAEQVKLSAHECAVIKLLNHDYMGKRFEYRVSRGKYLLPDIRIVKRAARKLSHGLET